MNIDHRRLAVTYLTAVHAGQHPTPVICAELGISRASIARELQLARQHGLLPPGQKGLAIPVDGDHWPRLAGFAYTTHQPRWLACQVDHQPWPCTDPATTRWLARIEQADP